MDDEPITIIRVNSIVEGQCAEMYCINPPHDGTIHSDYTGTVWDSATDEIIYGHDGE